MCYCTVTENGEPVNYILVGCVKNLKYHPSLQLSQPKIKTYTWDIKEGKTTLYHETEVEDIPMVLYAWKDKILAGVGKCLRCY